MSLSPTSPLLLSPCLWFSGCFGLELSAQLAGHRKRQGGKNCWIVLRCVCVQSHSLFSRTSKSSVHLFPLPPCSSSWCPSLLNVARSLSLVPPAVWLHYRPETIRRLIRTSGSLSRILFNCRSFVRASGTLCGPLSFGKTQRRNLLPGVDSTLEDLTGAVSVGRQSFPRR